MELITEQILNMFPLFILILLGYISGKSLKIKDSSIISKLILFVFTPIVAFNAISTADTDIGLIFLPIIFLITTSAIAIGTKLLSSMFSKKDNAILNTLAYSSGSGNVAFYGVPAVLILLGEEFLPIILISMIGYIIYDSSIGYLIITGQKFEVRKILLKLAKFPPFIGVVLGIIALILGVDLSSMNAYEFIVSSSQTTMATLGIFLIGLAVSNLKISLNYYYLILISINKVIINPLVIFLLLVVDSLTYNVFTEYANVLMLIASVPVATNSVILATEFTKKEQEASLGVLITAILSLISIPLWQAVTNAII